MDVWNIVRYNGFTLYRLDIHKTLSQTTLLPTIIYFPGTAFVAMETAYTDPICTLIVSESHCQLIAILPELSPDTPFIASVHKVYRLIDNFLLTGKNNNLNIDKSHVVVVGYSSGGTFAALVCMYAKKNKLPIQKQILISPVTDLSHSLMSYADLQNRDLAIPKWFVLWFLKLVTPTNRARDPKISPYWRTTIRVPSTTILHGEYDRFLADSIEYGNKLQQQGNHVTRYSFPKENHGLLWTNPTVSAKIALICRDVFGIQPIPRALKMYCGIDNNAKKKIIM